MRILFATLLICLALSALAKLRIDPETRWFLDEYGRVRIYHGVNVVFKTKPFYPTNDTFNSNFSLTDFDFEQIRGWGFNFIRLHVAWEGAEPQKGEYNITYLEAIRDIVRKGAKHGIDILLDAHQDVLNPVFCGEGFPDWAVSNSTFPAPKNDYKLGRDDKGYPLIEDCLKYDFFSMYWTKDVAKSLQNLYSNVNGLGDSFANFWKLVASFMKDEPNVLGYELINEPFVGDIFANPDLDKGDGLADILNLFPLYQRVHEKVREVDDRSIIFFECASTDNKVGFTEGPGGPRYNDRQAMAYHIYCSKHNPNGDPFPEEDCHKEYDFGFKIKTEGAENFKVAAFLSEFGAVTNSEIGGNSITYITERADQKFHSWAYWQYKYYNDITTSMRPGTKESLYDEFGKVQTQKVKALARTYFYAICGTPLETSFDITTGEYYLGFLASNNCGGQTSEFFASREFYYPYGFSVTYTECVGCSIVGNGVNRFQLIVPAENDGKHVEIVITASS